MAERLRLVIRTPHEVVVDRAVSGVRVPSATGQVGLRPRVEPCVLKLEPGLVLIRSDAGVRYAATAGGLLDVGRDRCVLYTPFAVEGGDDREVLAALSGALETPDSELGLRRRLGELEQRIAHALRGRRGQSAGAGP